MTGTSLSLTACVSLSICLSAYFFIAPSLYLFHCLSPFLSISLSPLLSVYVAFPSFVSVPSVSGRTPLTFTAFPSALLLPYRQRKHNHHSALPQRLDQCIVGHVVLACCPGRTEQERQRKEGGGGGEKKNRSWGNSAMESLWRPDVARVVLNEKAVCM